MTHYLCVQIEMKFDGMKFKSISVYISEIIYVYGLQIQLYNASVMQICI